VVALIRRLPVVISMRFHGVIFALSQGARVIGIDYRIGKRDKVAAVLADAGFEENCRRIDELEAGWLADRLAALSR
jgi:polysaccharide pyruvyl transferase WcaK-like protein